VEEGEQRCIDGQLVRAREALTQHRPSQEGRHCHPWAAPPPMRTCCPSGAVTLGSIA
jgi:hypothetical protein